MTLLADIIETEVFNPYVVEKTTDLASFYLGGIVSADPALDALALAGGSSINMPFWNDLTGDDEVLSDTASLTVSKITADQDVAALIMRGKGWSVNDLAKALSGSDPMAAIGDLVADFWARKRRDVAITSLDGVFASNIANNSSDMIKDLTTANAADVSPDNKFSSDAFIDGKATNDNSFDNYAGIAFHPHVYFSMLKQDKTSFEKESMGDAKVETYQGLRVIVDSSIPYTPATGLAAPIYTTYLFGNGALGIGNGGAPVPTETDRDKLAGNDLLITRDHFIMHPRGVKFTRASVAGSSPSNAELKNGANWLRVYERDNVRMAAVITNG